MSSNTFTFTITGKQNFLVLIQFLVANTIFLVGVIYVFDDIELNGFILFSLGLISLVIFWPVPILHLQYLIKNSKPPLIIDFEMGSITSGAGDRMKKFKISEIQELLFFSVSGANRSTKLIFDSYRYFVIKFKDGQKLIVTSLMINDIENTLPNILPFPVIRKVLVLPLINEK